jgi:hypothetical protein
MAVGWTFIKLGLTNVGTDTLVRPWAQAQFCMHSEPCRAPLDRAGEGTRPYVIIVLT